MKDRKQQLALRLVDVAYAHIALKLRCTFDEVRALAEARHSRVSPAAVNAAQEEPSPSGAVVAPVTGEGMGALSGSHSAHAEDQSTGERRRGDAGREAPFGAEVETPQQSTAPVDTGESAAEPAPLAVADEVAPSASSAPLQESVGPDSPNRGVAARPSDEGAATEEVPDCTPLAVEVEGSLSTSEPDPEAKASEGKADTAMGKAQAPSDGDASRAIQSVGSLDDDREAGPLTPADGLAVAVSPQPLEVGLPGVEAPGEPLSPEEAAPAEPVKLTIPEKIRAVLAEHPDWTARQIGDHLGVAPQAVNTAAKRHGILVRKLTPDELKAALGGAVRPAVHVPAPKMRQVDAEVPDVDHEAVVPFTSSVDALKPRTIRPKGARFRLRQKLGEGKYLFMSGEGLVDSKQYAWVGTEAQLLATRQKFLDAKDLVEEVVEDVKK